MMHSLSELEWVWQPEKGWLKAPQPIQNHSWPQPGCKCVFRLMHCSLESVNNLINNLQTTRSSQNIYCHLQYLTVHNKLTTGRDSWPSRCCYVSQHTFIGLSSALCAGILHPENGCRETREPLFTPQNTCWFCVIDMNQSAFHAVYSKSG